MAVRSFGIGGGTLRVPWLHDLLKTAASLAGVSSDLIAGRPTTLEEEELGPWLDAPLVLGGLREPRTQGSSITRHGAIPKESFGQDNGECVPIGGGSSDEDDDADNHDDE